MRRRIGWMICAVLFICVSNLRGQTLQDCAPYVSVTQGPNAPPDGIKVPFNMPDIEGSGSDPYQELGAYTLKPNTTISIYILPNNGYLGNPVSFSAALGAGNPPPNASVTAVTCNFQENGSSGQFWQPVLKFSPTTAGSYIFTLNFTACSSGKCGTYPVQYHLVVLPRYSQGDPSWALHTYDDYNDRLCKANVITPKCKMRKSGCQVTAVAMLLAGAGFSSPSAGLVNPPLLNDLARGNGGFTPGRDLDRAFVVNRVRLKYLPAGTKFKWKPGCGGDCFGDDTLADLQKALGHGSPVLLQVPHRANLCSAPTDPTLGHFVLVTNAQMDSSSPLIANGDHVRFYIHDPGCNPSDGKQGVYLDEYQINGKLPNTIRIVGYLGDPTDFSYFSVSSTDNVELTLTDASGRRVGFDPTSGGHVQEISGSFYLHEAEADPDTGEFVTGSNALQLETPESGTYLLSVTGGVGGDFAISIAGLATDGTELTQEVIKGTYSPGTNISYSISYSSTPGSQFVFSPKRLLGDLNGDGKVDCADIAIVKAAFGTVVGDTKYNLLADVNGDGVVDVLDLSAVARQLPAETTCP